MPAAAGAPEVVVLVGASGGVRAPGRDDAAMVAAYLADAKLPATVMATADGAPSCADAAADLVIVGPGVDRRLLECLANEDAVVLAHDERRVSGSDTMVTTRPSATRAIADLLGSERAEAARRGAVGVVAAPDLEPEVLAAIAASKVAPKAVRYLADDAPPSDAAAVAVALTTAGVDHVVLAVSVEQQRRFVAAYSVMRPSARYLVADTRDTVVDERYPPSFDGAVTVTTVRVPWQVRTEGETPQQAACRATWEAAVTPPSAADDAELARAFMWCQMVGLAARAAQEAAAGGELLESLRTPFASPLTFDLRTGDAGDYGPSRRAVLTWSLACRCWEEATDAAASQVTRVPGVKVAGIRM